MALLHYLIAGNVIVIVYSATRLASKTAGLLVKLDQFVGVQRKAEETGKRSKRTHRVLAGGIRRRPGLRERRNNLRARR